MPTLNTTVNEQIIPIYKIGIAVISGFTVRHKISAPNAHQFPGLPAIFFVFIPKNNNNFNVGFYTAFDNYRKMFSNF
jgi:hypothetical protein